MKGQTSGSPSFQIRNRVSLKSSPCFTKNSSIRRISSAVTSQVTSSHLCQLVVLLYLYHDLSGIWRYRAKAPWIDGAYPLVNIQKTIENGQRNSGFSMIFPQQKLWFSIVMLVYQRVPCLEKFRLSWRRKFQEGFGNSECWLQVTGEVVVFRVFIVTVRWPNAAKDYRPLILHENPLHRLPWTHDDSWIEGRSQLTKCRLWCWWLHVGDLWAWDLKIQDLGVSSGFSPREKLP